MTRRAAYACALVLGLLGVLVLPSAAHAGSSGVPHLRLHLSRTTITSGSPLTVSAHADALCDWIVEFNHDRRHTIGRSVRTTYVAPEVDVRTRLNVVATCVVRTPPTEPEVRPAVATSGSRRDVQTLVVRIPASATLDPPVIVLPAGTVLPPQVGGNGHDLPDTGGPSSCWLIAGLVSLALGATLVRRGPRSLPASPE